MRRHESFGHNTSRKMRCSLQPKQAKEAHEDEGEDELPQEQLPVVDGAGVEAARRVRLVVAPEPRPRQARHQRNLQQRTRDASDQLRQRRDTASAHRHIPCVHTRQSTPPGHASQTVSQTGHHRTCWVQLRFASEHRWLGSEPGGHLSDHVKRGLQPVHVPRGSCGDGDDRVEVPPRQVLRRVDCAARKSSMSRVGC